MNLENTPSQQDQKSQAELYGEFVGLLARHDQSIRRFARSLLHSREAVDDVMQETALECWKKFPAFVSEPHFDASSDDFIRWACVIAKYKVMSWQRDHARDRLVFRESALERLAESALESAEQMESERTAIEACLNNMTAEHRRLVLSAHVPGESIARIASETGAKARRLYSRVQGLRKTLLACLEKRLANEVEHA